MSRIWSFSKALLTQPILTISPHPRNNVSFFPSKSALTTTGEGHFSHLARSNTKSVSFTLAPEAGLRRVAFLLPPSRCVQASSGTARPAQPSPAQPSLAQPSPAQPSPAVVGAAHGASAAVCMRSSGSCSPGTSPHPALSSVIGLSTGSSASPTSSSC